MMKINKSALVPYTVSQMFALVDAIEHYPQFLPWCQQTEVHIRTPEEVQATIHVMKSGIHQSFTTLNRMTNEQKIEVQLVKGPFRHLEGLWRFEEITASAMVDTVGCKVNFDMEFEFSSKLIAMTAGHVLQKIAESFVDAFCQRAREVYGKLLPN